MQEPKEIQDEPFSIHNLLQPSPAGGFALFFVLGLLFFGWILPSRPSQPIAYNHSIHIESGLECANCHTGVEEQAQATLPGVETCMMCHAEAGPDNPEQAKIPQFAAEGKDIPWVQITRVPRHVYFSHRRHVSLGKLECASCHGDMAQLTRPPTRPLKTISMDVCMDCHEQRNVRNDCNDCHR